jgi:hypothetical protein
MSSPSNFLFDLATGALVVKDLGGGGGSSDVNIIEILGSPVALGNPLFVELSDGTNALGTNANPIRTSPGSGAATQPVSGSVAVTNFPATQPVSGTVAVSNFPATQPVSGSVSVSNFPATQPISAVSLPLPANAAQETGGNLASIKADADIIAAAVGAPAATAPTKAILEGLRANVGSTLPTAVTDGQLVDAMADKLGRTVTLSNGHRSLLGTAVLSSSSNSLVSFIGSAGGSLFTDIVTFIVTNESSTPTVVSLSDGTTTYKFAIAANGGGVFTFASPLPATSAATAWQVLNSAGVALDYVALYVKNS